MSWKPNSLRDRTGRVCHCDHVCIIEREETMTRKAVSLALIFLVGSLMLVACSDSGPEPGFDVTGLWTEQGGDSTFEFTENGGYDLNFDPPLSDGTTQFGGESYNRIDNSHLTFTALMGRITSLEIIEVEATINSENVLRFRLDGKTYRFTKADG